MLSIHGGRASPRTTLEWAIWELDRTYEEIADDFCALARRMGEKVTITARHLRRLASGERSGTTPATRRVLQERFSCPADVLLGPYTGAVIPLKNEAPRPARSSPLNLGGDTDFHEEIVMAAEESARFVRRSGVSLTPEVLEQMEADTHWLAAEYLRRSPYSVFRQIAALRHDVFEVIDRHSRLEYLPALYRTAGQLSALLAHVSGDFGQPYAADSHTRTAWLCADVAHDNALRSYVRWVQSNIAYWRGRHTDAANLARSGQQFATTRSDILRLSSQEARACAAARDNREAEHALGAAMAAREQATDEPAPPGVFYFDPAKASYYASEVRLSLGGTTNARLAVRDAQEALNILDMQTEPSAELVAAAQLDLISARLALSDLDAAASSAQEVLHLPSESRTVPIMGRVQRISHELAVEPFQAVKLAQELTEQISVFSAYPAARQIPELA